MPLTSPPRRAGIAPGEGFPHGYLGAAVPWTAACLTANRAHTVPTWEPPSGRTQWIVAPPKLTAVVDEISPGKLRLMNLRSGSIIIPGTCELHEQVSSAFHWRGHRL